MGSAFVLPPYRYCSFQSKDNGRHRSTAVEMAEDRCCLWQCCEVLLSMFKATPSPKLVTVEALFSSTYLHTEPRMRSGLQTTASLHRTIQKLASPAASDAHKSSTLSLPLPLPTRPSMRAAGWVNLTLPHRSHRRSGSIPLENQSILFQAQLFDFHLFRCLLNQSYRRAVEHVPHLQI